MNKYTVKWRYPRNGVLCYNNAHILQIPHIMPTSIVWRFLKKIQKHMQSLHSYLSIEKCTICFIQLDIYGNIFVVCKFALQNVILQYPANCVIFVVYCVFCKMLKALNINNPNSVVHLISCQDD